MTAVRTSGGNRSADGAVEGRRPRVMPRLLRGGAAGIAGVLLTASPTWGAGMDISHRYLAERDDRARTHGSPGPRGGSPWERGEPPDTAVGAGAGGAREDADGAGAPDRRDSRSASGTGAADGWTRPVADAEVSAAYGIPGGWLAGRHTGVDFAVPVGTPVRSPGPGEVVTAGWGGAYGHLVTMRTEGGQYLLFAHLSRIDAAPGQRVGPGELLGLSGNTGRSSGPHLHFEVRQSTEYGSDINPRSYLASKGVRL
ncbi:M23 family metallopeptidase [Streptomyces sp. WAC 00631]|uniref:M23 family metallopeptidase n=1 Tax=unclassified Streptomyces TaxID=2593676 RepID=UPI000F77CEAF|nr:MULTISPECIES: M23 family metallopeptidase [unclassified Streptomyces]MCC5033750.1 M23 family metallopeptidase [Streptomyces sp. WAC 00631]MCC9742861.1 M23 family metallopeptidase [Streptomyces sp. MNU89]